MKCFNCEREYKLKESDSFYKMTYCSLNCEENDGKQLDLFKLDVKEV